MRCPWPLGLFPWLIPLFYLVTLAGYLDASRITCSAVDVSDFFLLENSNHEVTTRLYHQSSRLLTFCSDLDRWKPDGPQSVMCFRWGCREEQPGPRALWVDSEGAWCCAHSWPPWWRDPEETCWLRHQDLNEDPGAEQPHSLHRQTVRDEKSCIIMILDT